VTSIKRVCSTTPESPGAYCTIQLLQSDQGLALRAVPIWAFSLVPTVGVFFWWFVGFDMIRLRCVTQPDNAQAVVLERLGIVLPMRMRMTELDLPAVALSA
jgi:hypothetical protein